MHKYIFNVSADRMSNYPVIEQSVCSAVINYAIFLLLQNILRLRRAAESSLFRLLSRTSGTQTKPGAGKRELGTAQTLAFGPSLANHLDKNQVISERPVLLCGLHRCQQPLSICPLLS